MDRARRSSSQILCCSMYLHVHIRRMDILESAVPFECRPQIGPEEPLHDIVRHFPEYVAVDDLRPVELHFLGRFHRRTFIHDKAFWLSMGVALGIPEETCCCIPVLLPCDRGPDHFSFGIPDDPDIGPLPADGDRHGICVPLGAELDLVLPEMLPEPESETPHPFLDNHMTPFDIEELFQGGSNFTIRQFVSGEKGKGNGYDLWVCPQSVEVASPCLLAELPVTYGTFVHLGSGGGEAVLSAGTTTTVRTNHGGPIGVSFTEDIYVCLRSYQSHENHSVRFSAVLPPFHSSSAPCECLCSPSGQWAWSWSSPS